MKENVISSRLSFSTLNIICMYTFTVYMEDLKKKADKNVYNLGSRLFITIQLYINKLYL